MRDSWWKPEQHQRYSHAQHSDNRDQTWVWIIFQIIVDWTTTPRNKKRFCPYRYKLQHVASKEALLTFCKATVLHPCSQTGTNAFTVTGSSGFFYVHHQEKVCVQTRKTYFPKSPRCPRCSRFKDNHVVPCSKSSFISETNTSSSFLIAKTSQQSLSQ